MADRGGVRPREFFRFRLLRAQKVEDIRAILSESRHDQQELRAHIASIMWHMRGSLSREEAWTLSPDERKDISKLIEERLKIVEKTRMPLL